MWDDGLLRPGWRDDFPYDHGSCLETALRQRRVMRYPVIEATRLFVHIQASLTRPFTSIWGISAASPPCRALESVRSVQAPYHRGVRHRPDTIGIIFT